jgi:hypothetical protein
MLTHTITIALPQGGGTEYRVPVQPVEQLHHPRLAQQLDKLNQAKTAAADTQAAWVKAKQPRTGSAYNDRQAAYEQLHAQLLETIDFASATAGTAKAHATEQYRLGAARYERARQQMLAALHECAVAANMAATVRANPAALGVDVQCRDSLYLHVGALASQVQQLQLRPIAD